MDNFHSRIPRWLFSRRHNGRRASSKRIRLTHLLAFVVLLGFGLVWALSGSVYRLEFGISILSFVILGYSWNLLGGFTGYISLGHVVFYGFGSYAAAEFILKLGWDWRSAVLITPLLSMIIAVPIGLVMLRLRGIYFALGMFSLVYLASLLVSEWDFTGAGNGLVIPGELAQREILLWMVGAAILAFGLNVYMSTSHFGLLAMSIRDDEEAATAMGVSVLWIKVTIFSLSAALPALVGSLTAYNRSYINNSGMFDPKIDLMTILYVLAGGMGTIWGPLIGSVLLGTIGEQLWVHLPNIQLALFGVLIVVVIVVLPGGLVGLLNRFGLLLRPVVRSDNEDRESGAVGDEASKALAEYLPRPDGSVFAADAAGPVDCADEVVGCRNLSVKFGGVYALKDVDVSIRRGEMVFIIGANGAGKTTLFNAFTNMVAPSTGEVFFNGQNVSKTPVHKLARQGLARTFQIPRLFESLTVWENILVAALGGRQRSSAERHAAWVVEVMELESIQYQATSTLPVGHRRLVELARGLALHPEIILLDEVMAGMNQEELTSVRQTLRRMSSFGVGTVAGIEHVLHAIVDLADRIIVIDGGKVLAAGSPEEILRLPEVVDAYLGEEISK